MPAAWRSPRGRSRGEVRRDNRTVGPLLDPLHPAERAVVEHDPGDGQLLLDRRAKLVDLHLERAVAGRADDLAVRPRQLGRHRADTP